MMKTQLVLKAFETREMFLSWFEWSLIIAIVSKFYTKQPHH